MVRGPGAHDRQGGGAGFRPLHLLGVEGASYIVVQTVGWMSESVSFLLCKVLNDGAEKEMNVYIYSILRLYCSILVVSYCKCLKGDAVPCWCARSPAK